VSSWKAVSSGVRQLSVSGPIIFLIAIKHLDSALTSTIIKFVDDIKLFGTINTDINREVLRRDLYRLLEWSEKRQNNDI